MWLAYFLSVYKTSAMSGSFTVLFPQSSGRNRGKACGSLDDGAVPILTPLLVVGAVRALDEGDQALIIKLNGKYNT